LVGTVAAIVGNPRIADFAMHPVLHRTLTVLIALGICGSNLQAQALTVSVRDSLGTPLSQVALALLDTTGRVIVSARTSPAGVAHMPKADTGTFLVFARRFGFKPRYSARLHIGRGDTVAVRLTLERAPAILDPVVIVVQRDSLRREWNPFGINFRATGGYFITPSEIEAAILGARDMADVLARRAIPGILIDHIRRCPRSNRGAGCLPFVIDGQLFPDGTALQDVVVPEMVDYVVVLRGSEVGVRYGSIGHNGIILIATKRADWWRRRR
jgi:hypothetical protein